MFDCVPLAFAWERTLGPGVWIGEEKTGTTTRERNGRPQEEVDDAKRSFPRTTTRAGMQI